MNRERFFLVLFLALATLATVLFFWQEPIIVVVVLIITAVGLFLVRTTMFHLKIFLTGFFFGPLAEIAAVVFGVWEYALPQSYTGIPLWPPFV